MSLEKRLEFFTESRHALGKTALMLSGGASLGMYHFGVIKALANQQLLPRVISGSSAGAIVAAILGVRTNEELNDLFDNTSNIRLEFFGNPHGSCESSADTNTSFTLSDTNTSFTLSASFHP